MSALSTFNVRLDTATTFSESEGRSSPSPSSVSVAGRENEGDNVEPSETAALTALFGWMLPPQPTEEKPTQKTPSAILSRSRASSVISLRNGRSTTPQHPPSISRRESHSPTSASVGLSAVPPSTTYTPQQKRDASLLYCKMCQRRVGLWAFGPHAVEKGNRPQRQFDLLREHRPYCPYVVRSTIVPSFPTPGHNAVLNGANGNGSLRGVPIEGWRALLSIVLKAKKRSFYGSSRSIATVGSVAVGEADGSTESFANAHEMEADRVEVMVEGVKKRGVSSCSSISYHPSHVLVG